MLIGFVRREKFQNRVIFIPGAEARDPLSPVDIKDPHRSPEKAGNAREKITKRLFLLIILDGKAPV